MDPYAVPAGFWADDNPESMDSTEDIWLGVDYDGDTVTIAGLREGETLQFGFTEFLAAIAASFGFSGPAHFSDLPPVPEDWKTND